MESAPEYHDGHENNNNSLDAGGRRSPARTANPRVWDPARVDVPTSGDGETATAVSRGIMSAACCVRSALKAESARPACRGRARCARPRGVEDRDRTRDQAPEDIASRSPTASSAARGGISIFSGASTASSSTRSTRASLRGRDAGARARRRQDPLRPLMPRTRVVEARTDARRSSRFRRCRRSTAGPRAVAGRSRGYPI
jgi:hypothetical protein